MPPDWLPGAAPTIPARLWLPCLLMALTDDGQQPAKPNS